MKRRAKHKDLEELSALLDQELDPARNAEMIAAILRDPALRALFESYKRQNEHLRALYDPILDEPVPCHLLKIARDLGDKD